MPLHQLMKIGIFKLTGFLLTLNLVTGLVGCQVNGSAPANEDIKAVVQDITASGADGNYNFTVTLKSPDTGCDQYANWWEVISEDGTTLIYRRILGHSHVDEQPFSRSGGPVDISPNTEVIIRAHMHPSGYGDGLITMKGTVDDGFTTFEIPKNFAATFENVQPQPTGCAF